MSWIQAARQPAVWRRAFLVGGPVGALQVVVNQGDVWMTHIAAHQSVVASVVAKTLLSPFITVTVAWVSAACAWADRERAKGVDGDL
jgi:hypothetical protein